MKLKGMGTWEGLEGGKESKKSCNYNLKNKTKVNVTYQNYPMTWYTF